MGVNMIAAVVLAAFATAFALKAKRDSILFPFYREGDCEGMALWLIVMVVELNVRGSLLLLALPFAVGYLFGRSLYAGYVGIAIVVGVAFLFEAVNIYMFELVGKRQQWKT